ncbi:Ig-like domain-containing protein [Kamptonema formosum]|uniref:Ig-like domain-containing protein n=1 Tax=Kamptonema formosum TaxID=331992 RepID=UPI0040484063
MADVPTLTGTDTDGTVVSYTISTLPDISQGKLFLNGVEVTAGQILTPAQAAQLKFQPNPSFTGSATFTYSATDNSGAVDATPATVTIPVTAPNTPPVAEDKTAPATANNVIADVPTLTGTDTDGTVVSYTISTLPDISQGKLFLNGVEVTAGQILTPAQAAQLKFQPNPSFTGSATFTYTATDNDGDSDTTPATVTIPVTAPNTPPVAEDKTAPATANNVIADVPTLTGTDTDGTVVSYTISTLPDISQGKLFLNGVEVTAGQILTPAQAAQLKFQPNPSFTGSATFTYSATDNSGAVDATPATVTIPVTAPNTPPVATNDSGFTNPGVPVSINVLGNDTDANGDTLTVTDFTQPANGTVSCTPAGVCTYTPNPGFTGTDTYTYTISDGKGGTATATVKITVPIPANQPPVPANKTAPSTPNNTPVQIPALSATDPNAGDTIASYTISTLPAPSQGVLLLNRQPVQAGQKLTPSEAAQLIFQPNPNFTGDASFTYTATDNSGASSTPAAVTIPVTAPPKANLRLVKRITRINSTTFNDLASDPADPDDKASGWPSNYLLGKIDGGKILPGDEIEYTIYFLSDGGATANNVTICDLVPRNLTFIPGGISVFVNGSQLSYTDAGDGDGGQFYTAGTSLPASCRKGNEIPQNTNGAVVVNLGNIPSATGSTPSNSYGFVRFRAKFEQ